ncbi:hypothetical protein Tco_0716500 [Tanacetum coccineum]
MTVSANFLINVVDVSNLGLTVGHPNGTHTLIIKIGDLKINDHITLYNVPVVPKYKVSLLSVHKLARDNNLFVGFDDHKCYIQDLKENKIVGIGNVNDDLYLFNIDSACPHGELDGVVSPPDELDTPKLVKLVKMGPSGELDGISTLPDGRDTTKTVETNLVILRRPWFHAILDLTSVLTPLLLLGKYDACMLLGDCKSDMAIGPHGELDRVVSPPDELDTAKLVKLVKMGH